MGEFTSIFSSFLGRSQSGELLSFKPYKNSLKQSQGTRMRSHIKASLLISEEESEFFNLKVFHDLVSD